MPYMPNGAREQSLIVDDRRRRTSTLSPLILTRQHFYFGIDLDPPLPLLLLYKTPHIYIYIHTRTHTNTPDGPFSHVLGEEKSLRLELVRERQE
jgi:hypothetical protein